MSHVVQMWPFWVVQALPVAVTPFEQVHVFCAQPLLAVSVAATMCSCAAHVGVVTGEHTRFCVVVAGAVVSYVEPSMHVVNTAHCELASR